MSTRHRVALALNKYDPAASYAYETFTTEKTAYFIFKQARSAELVKEMLRILIKRKPLIHKGRKP